MCTLDGFYQRLNKIAARFIEPMQILENDDRRSDANQSDNSTKNAPQPDLPELWIERERGIIGLCYA